MTANLYERFLQADSMEAYAPDSVMPSMPALDALELPFSPTTLRTVNISATIPAVHATTGVCQMWFPITPEEPPSKGSSIVVTDESGNVFYPVIGSTTPTANQMRVYDDHPGWIDFHEDRAGENITVTIIGAVTVWNAQMVRRFATELNAMQTALATISSPEMTAAAALTKGNWVYAYLDGDTVKANKAGLTDGIYPVGFASAGVSMSATFRPVMSGWVTGIGSAGSQREVVPPPGVWLYQSPEPGGFTWIGDSDATYKLGATSPLIPIAFHVGAGRAFVNIQTPQLKVG